jgi:MFS family permease
VPSVQTLGLAAPAIVIGLRILQGLALGGEYGGAAVYVAEHAPPEKRGFYTSFIQASVVGGFVLSIIVVVACRAFIAEDVFAAWGWRVPFLLSLILLAISLWMRLKLSESPVFQAMKNAGEMAKNPFVESMTYPGNPKRLFVALFGITGVLTTIWYTAFFSGMSFLRGPMRVEDGTVEVIMLIAAGISMAFYVLVGRWSDRIGRKRPIIIGAAATLLLMIPIFWGIGALANPGLAASAERAPVNVSGVGCHYDPFSSKQATPCGRLLADLTGLGVSYKIRIIQVRFGSAPEMVTVGDQIMDYSGMPDAARKTAVQTLLE